MMTAQAFLHTDKYLADMGGISAYLVAFGALYGIISAFIVVEVWNKFNNTKYLIEQEAAGLEKLYLLSTYFHDKKFSEKVYANVKTYISIIVDNNFKHLKKGKKHPAEEQAFDQLAQDINHVKFDDDHDGQVFGLIVDHYANLAQTRTERLHKCILRLPLPIRVFFYASSFFMVITFIFMPFVNIYYGTLVTGTFVFSLALLIYIIEDLDNPFFGDMWHITPETFKDSLTHIEEKYTALS